MTTNRRKRAGSAPGRSSTSTPVPWNNGAAHTATALPFPAGDNFLSGHDINNLGQITGIGVLKGQATPFVMTPATP